MRCIIIIIMLSMHVYCITIELSAIIFDKKKKAERTPESGGVEINEVEIYSFQTNTHTLKK